MYEEEYTLVYLSFRGSPCVWEEIGGPSRVQNGQSIECNFFFFFLLRWREKSKVNTTGLKLV